MAGSSIRRRDDNSEFADSLGSGHAAAGNGSPAANRVDLLTTVMHELGHVLGFGTAIRSTSCSQPCRWVMTFPR